MGSLGDAPGGPTRGWYLDDDVDAAFLDRVRELAPRIVSDHTGIAEPVPAVLVAWSEESAGGPSDR